MIWHVRYLLCLGFLLATSSGHEASRWYGADSSRKRARNVRLMTDGEGGHGIDEGEPEVARCPPWRCSRLGS